MERKRDKEGKMKPVAPRKKRQLVLRRKDDKTVDSEASTLVYSPPLRAQEDTFRETNDLTQSMAEAHQLDRNSNASSSESEGEDLPLLDNVPVNRDRWGKKEVDALMDAVNMNRAAIKFHFTGTQSGREIRRQGWRDVALYVNMEAKTHRTVRQCRDKTSDFTQKQKKKYNTLRRELNKTGSAPPPKKMRMSGVQAKALDYLKVEAVRGIPGVTPMQLNPSENRGEPKMKEEDIWKPGTSDFRKVKEKMKVTKVPKKEKDKETRRKERRKKEERKKEHEKKMKAERRREEEDQRWRNVVKETSRKKEEERKAQLAEKSKGEKKARQTTVIKCTPEEFEKLREEKAKRKAERAMIREARKRSKEGK